MIAQRCGRTYPGSFSARTSYSTPAVTRATSGTLCSGIRGVVWSAIASRTIRSASPLTPCARRKSRAALAQSTPRRSCSVRCPRRARCRGTSRRCRAVRSHSAGRGARPAGHPTSTRAVSGGTGHPTRRCESGRLRHAQSGCRGSRERTWFGGHALGSFRRCLLSLGVPIRASIRWRLGGWLPASTASSSQARSASTGGEP
jgi:hypothetical protein